MLIAVGLESGNCAKSPALCHTAHHRAPPPRTACTAHGAHVSGPCVACARAMGTPTLTTFSSVGLGSQALSFSPPHLPDVKWRNGEHRRGTSGRPERKDKDRAGLSARSPLKKVGVTGCLCRRLPQATTLFGSTRPPPPFHAPKCLRQKIQRQRNKGPSRIAPPPDVGCRCR